MARCGSTPKATPFMAATAPSLVPKSVWMTSAWSAANSRAVSSMTDRNRTSFLGMGTSRNKKPPGDKHRTALLVQTVSVRVRSEAVFHVKRDRRAGERQDGGVAVDRVGRGPVLL